jgi:ribonuclease VapC
MCLSTKLAAEPTHVEAAISAILRAIEIVSIGEAEAKLAVQAFSGYGKGKGPSGAAQFLPIASPMLARRTGASRCFTRAKIFPAPTWREAWPCAHGTVAEL